MRTTARAMESRTRHGRFDPRRSVRRLVVVKGRVVRGRVRNHPARRKEKVQAGRRRPGGGLDRRRRLGPSADNLLMFRLLATGGRVGHLRRLVQTALRLMKGQRLFRRWRLLLLLLSPTSSSRPNPPCCGNCCGNKFPSLEARPPPPLLPPPLLPLGERRAPCDDTSSSLRATRAARSSSSNTRDPAPTKPNPSSSARAKLTLSSGREPALPSALPSALPTRA
mmetsp:Transcript_3958/g.7375  ORF Transcript_3958/g.7375 Transcript_3958/m.7375 type:complete len:223 (+) Transcript_3958:319-987(+)